MVVDSWVQNRAQPSGMKKRNVTVQMFMREKAIDSITTDRQHRGIPKNHIHPEA